MNSRIRTLTVLSIPALFLGFYPGGMGQGHGQEIQAGFFQPAPIVDQSPMKFAPASATPPEPDFPGSHWDTDTSQRYCDDDDVATAANAAGKSIGKDCKQYARPMTLATGPKADLVEQSFTPHQMALVPFLYWSLCPIDIKMDPANPSVLLSYGWDTEPNDAHGFTYTGCYGWNEPAILGVDQRTFSMTNVFLGNSSSDKMQDGYDDWAPYDIPDPVNLVYEVDHPEFQDAKMTEKLPISITTGRFFRDIDTTDVKTDPEGEGRLIDTSVGISKVLTMLGMDAEDIAVLRRGKDGAGYVSFINNVGSGSDPLCADKALKDSCPTLCGSSGTDAACTACMTTNIATIKAKLKLCHKTYTYPDNAIAGDYLLEGAKEPVFITYFNPTKQYSKPEINTSGAAPSSFERFNPGNFRYGSYAKMAGLVYESDVSSAPAPAEKKGADGGSEGLNMGRRLNEIAASSGVGTFFPGYNVSRPLLMVLSRAGEDCFNDYIRFRNAKLDSDGKITSADVKDTNGIPVYKGAVTQPAIMPAAGGSESCSYYTFYRPKAGADGKPAGVEVVKDPEDNIVKIPAGHNGIYGEPGDFNGDGWIDFATINTGSHKEGINGSVSVMFCLPNGLASALPVDPATNKPPYFPLCRTGYVVKDIPLPSDKSIHPWGMTAGVFKGHQVQGKSSLEARLAPSDLALTYLDSYKDTNGDFAVLINRIDADSAKNSNTYKYWNDVNFDIKAVDATALPSGARKKVKGYSYYPLAITNEFFGLDQYTGKDGGIYNFMAHAFGDLLAPGYSASVSVTSSGSTIPLFHTACRSLIVGFNNSGFAGWYKNPEKGDKVSALSPLRADDPNTDQDEKVDIQIEGVPCDGIFVSPKERNTDLPDTTTAVYSKYGGWGAKFATSGLLTTMTERAYREGTTDIVYAGAGGSRLDVELSGTPGFTSIDGPPLKIPETPILVDGGAPDSSYALPNDKCEGNKYPFFEVTTVVKDTVRSTPACLHSSVGGTENSCESGWDSGADPITSHRCRQRYGAGQHVRAACCLILDHPEVASYAGSTIDANLPTDCPAGDPIECCAMQNTVGALPTVDWTKPIPVTDAKYNPESPACLCTKEKGVMSSLVGSTDWSGFFDAANELCKCYSENGIAIDPVLKNICLPPPPGLCVGIADPDLKKCCEAGKSFAECGKPCSGISDSALKACCDAGKPLTACVPPPTHDICDDSLAPEYQECCRKNGGALTAAMFDECFGSPGECKAGITITATEGSTINIEKGACLISCCQNVVAEGTKVDVKAIQECRCDGTPKSDCDDEKALKDDVGSKCNPFCTDHPDDPTCQTTTAGSGVEKAECVPVDDTNVVDGKYLAITAEGSAMGFVVNCSPGALSGISQIKLIQTGGLEVGLDNTPGPGGSVTSPKELVTKAAAGGLLDLKQVITVPRPTTPYGIWKPDMKLTCEAYDPTGKVLKSLPVECGAALQAQGACGCAVASSRPKDAMGNMLLVLSILSLPFLMRRRLVKDRFFRKS